MANRYVDLVNGSDANDGLGPYKAAYTSGGTTAIVVGDTITGNTSGQTAKVVLITVTGGSWAAGDAAGAIYVGTPSGAFSDGEALLVGGNDLATLTADFALNSKKTISGACSGGTILDEIRVKKSAAPVSLGINATFTDASETITLASPLTKTVDNCETNWTAEANVTRSDDVSYKKQGTKAQQFAIASAFTTGIVASIDLGADMDLSAYTKLSFWFHISVDLAAANVFQIDLTDSADAVLHSLPINHSLYYDDAYSWSRILLDNAGAFASNVRKVKLVAASDPGTVTVKIDNIIACNDFNHRSVIGANNEYWYAIKSIDNTTITLPSFYRGSTGSQAAYGIHDWVMCNVTAATTDCEATGNTNGQLVRGGWDFATDNQDGWTNLAGLSQNGRGLHINGTWKSHFQVQYFRFAHLYDGLYVAAAMLRTGIKNIQTLWCRNSGVYANSAARDNSITRVEGDYNFSQASPWHIAASPAGTGAAGYQAGCLWTGTFKYHGNPLTGGQVLYLHSGDFMILGTLELSIDSSAASTLNFDCGNVTIGKLKTTNTAYPFMISTCGNVNIVDWEHTSGNISNWDFLGGAYLCYGRFRIGRTNLTAKPTGITAKFGYFGGLSVDSLGAADRYASANIAGICGDHVTMGQAAGWGHGGSGPSFVMSPSLTDMALVRQMFVPVEASITRSLKFYVIKTSAAANCTAFISIYGCGITPVVRESITLTDAWAQFASTAFTTTDKGFLTVILETYDGSTTGDIGFDTFTVEAP